MRLSGEGRAGFRRRDALADINRSGGRNAGPAGTARNSGSQPQRSCQSGEERVSDRSLLGNGPWRWRLGLPWIRPNASRQTPPTESPVFRQPARTPGVFQLCGASKRMRSATRRHDAAASRATLPFHDMPWFEKGRPPATCRFHFPTAMIWEVRCSERTTAAARHPPCSGSRLTSIERGPRSLDFNDSRK